MWPMGGCQHTSIERRVLMTQNTMPARVERQAWWVGGPWAGAPHLPLQMGASLAQHITPPMHFWLGRQTAVRVHTQTRGEGGGRHSCVRGLVFVGAPSLMMLHELKVAHRPNTASCRLTLPLNNTCHQSVSQKRPLSCCAVPPAAHRSRRSCCHSAHKLCQAGTQSLAGCWVLAVSPWALAAAAAAVAAAAEEASGVAGWGSGARAFSAAGAAAAAAAAAGSWKTAAGW